PYIGQKALKNSIIALVLSLVLITAYVWIRFRVLSGLSAGVMGVLALLHDVLIVFFVFVAFKIPLNDAFVAVTLTIIGYSINDTIVLYDRIRENRRKDSKIPLGELIDLSTTQTLSRTMNSSFTTTACVLMILIFAVLYGITSIKVFALPMLFGLICGCYSSICIAAPLWVSWSEFKEKRMRRKE
ncbi:MAG: protein translocase subunit SecF, partial [Lachnospiraceae bacterium]